MYISIKWFPLRYFDRKRKERERKKRNPVISHMLCMKAKQTAWTWLIYIHLTFFFLLIVLLHWSEIRVKFRSLALFHHTFAHISRFCLVSTLYTDIWKRFWIVSFEVFSPIIRYRFIETWIGTNERKMSFDISAKQIRTVWTDCWWTYRRILDSHVVY